MTIAENAELIRGKAATAALKSGREAAKVKIIAVTKYSDNAETQEFIDAGFLDLAENRADRFLEKFDAFSEQGIRWHFIGNLQSRKVRDVINKVDVFHALDSVKLANEIEKRANHVISCFLEVNVSGEESKHGFDESSIFSAIDAIKAFSKVKVIGLMTMAPIDANEDELREIFTKTRQLQEKIAALNIANIPCRELSMGMSRDYEIAIECGATYVRVGHEFLK